MQERNSNRAENNSCSRRRYGAVCQTRTDSIGRMGEGKIVKGMEIDLKVHFQIRSFVPLPL